MEDAHSCVLDLQPLEGDQELKPASSDIRISFFGVYDGHGGDKVALYTGEHLHKIIAKQDAFKSGQFEQALKDGFLAIDRAILNGMDTEALSTACNDLTCWQTLDTRKKCPDARLLSPSARMTKSTWYVLAISRARMIHTQTSIQGNAGDSRTVLGVKGRAKPLSFDHKPQNEGMASLSSRICVTG